MLCEVGEKRRPIVLVLLRSRFRAHRLVFLSRLVPPDATFIPWADRVARNVGSKPAGQSELHVFVEDRVVECPRAILGLYVANHRLVAVAALAAPRKTHDCRRDDFLAERRKLRPKWAHRVVMLLRKRRRLAAARDGPRMLPEIEVIAALAHRSYRSIKNLDAEISERMDARLRITRHLDLHDARCRRCISPDDAVERI